MKTAPFAHQARNFEQYRDEPARALFDEQGTGKTWVLLATAEHLHRTGQVDAMLLAAPNGVHTNFVRGEVPRHLADPCTAVAYNPSKASTKRHKNELNTLFEPRPLPILAMSYDALITKKGYALAEEFLKRHRVLFVLDEAHRIKHVRAKRTKSALKLAKLAPYRRIATGTPITNSPLDVYTQILFLDPTFWANNKIGSYLSFKHRYAKWKTQYGPHGRFEQCIGYQNLDELHELLDTISTRVLKADVFDLPDRLYTKHRFELPSKQRKLYDTLRKTLQIELAQHETVTAPLAITLLLRLQELACGYMKADDGSIHTIEPNPRIQALWEILDDNPTKTIIFARFKNDIRQIVKALDKIPHVVYEGATSVDDRMAAIEKFQTDPDTTVFVGNVAACSTGITLTAAERVVYYSNSFDLERRLQSEARAHRAGTKKSVLYVDLIADGTVDEIIVDALRKKKNIAGEVVRQDASAWI